jgi:hypothetical protein
MRRGVSEVERRDQPESPAAAGTCEHVDGEHAPLLRIGGQFDF